jgi:hypothetical protein
MILSAFDCKFSNSLSLESVDQEYSLISCCRVTEILLSRYAEASRDLPVIYAKMEMLRHSLDLLREERVADIDTRSERIRKVRRSIAEEAPMFGAPHEIDTGFINVGLFRCWCCNTKEGLVSMKI